MSGPGFLLVWTIPDSLCCEQNTHRGPQRNPNVACLVQSLALQRGFETFAMPASLCVLQKTRRFDGRLPNEALRKQPSARHRSCFDMFPSCEKIFPGACRTARAGARRGAVSEHPSNYCDPPSRNLLTVGNTWVAFAQSGGWSASPWLCGSVVEGDIHCTDFRGRATLRAHST